MITNALQLINAQRSRPRPPARAIGEGGGCGEGGGAMGVQGRASCTQLAARLIKYGSSPALADPPVLRRAAPSAHALPPLLLFHTYIYIFKEKLCGCISPPPSPRRFPPPLPSRRAPQPLPPPHPPHPDHLPHPDVTSAAAEPFLPPNEAHLCRPAAAPSYTPRLPLSRTAMHHYPEHPRYGSLVTHFNQ